MNQYPIIYRYKNGQIAPRSYDSSKPLNDQPFYDMTQSEISRAKLYYPDNILYPDTPAMDNRGVYKDVYERELGPDEYWMMGDNRQGSWDSRDWGPLNIKKTLFHGRILFRIWSVDSDESWWIVDLIKHPINFWKRVRWSRFFQVLN